MASRQNFQSKKSPTEVEVYQEGHSWSMSTLNWTQINLLMLTFKNLDSPVVDFKFYTSSSNRICISLCRPDCWKTWQRSMQIFFVPAYAQNKKKYRLRNKVIEPPVWKQHHVKMGIRNLWCLKVPPGSLSCWILSDLSGHFPTVPPHFGIPLQQLQQLRPTWPPPAGREEEEGLPVQAYNWHICT